MCTLLAHVPDSPEKPFYLGANRDEDYSRRSMGPGILSKVPIVWGGKDLEAGGTWLGVRTQLPSRIAAILNRPALPGADPHAPPPSGAMRRSRGLLCLEAARADTMALAEVEARRQVQTFGSAPFNLFIADAESVRVIAYDGAELRSRSLAPGWHALTHGTPDDRGDPRIAQALEQVADAPPTLDLLIAVLSRNDGSGAACRHGERYGTVSSMMIKAQLADGNFECRYFDGPPCSTAYDFGLMQGFA